MTRQPYCNLLDKCYTPVVFGLTKIDNNAIKKLEHELKQDTVMEGYHILFHEFEPEISGCQVHHSNNLQSCNTSKVNGYNHE